MAFQNQTRTSQFIYNYESLPRYTSGHEINGPIFIKAVVGPSLSSRMTTEINVTLSLSGSDLCVAKENRPYLNRLSDNQDDKAKGYSQVPMIGYGGY